MKCEPLYGTSSGIGRRPLLGKRPDRGVLTVDLLGKYCSLLDGVAPMEAGKLHRAGICLSLAVHFASSSLLGSAPWPCRQLEEDSMLSMRS